MSNGSTKVSCTCAHEFQDKTYGKQTRIACGMVKNDKTGSNQSSARCTVCGRVHEVKKSDIK